MNKKYLILFSLSGLLFSCGETSSDSEVETKYTITWVNEDNSVLEIDENVSYGSLPTYDGETPTKSSDENFTYTFSSWTPEITTVTKDQTYTATYTKFTISKPDNEPIPNVSEDGTSVLYGSYPQTHITDTNIIAKLEDANHEVDGIYTILDGEKYISQVAKTYNNEEFTFQDNTPILNGKTYWFKLEPIEWRVLENKNNEYYLLSETLLDIGIFNSKLEKIVENNEVFAPNNYISSDIRSFLNNDFYNLAFGTSSYIKKVNNDSVFLPTVNDYLNTDYGFNSDLEACDLSKVAKVSDYALCRGSWKNTRDPEYVGNGTYWTSSADENTSYTAYNINSGGFVSNYAVDGTSSSIRPAIKIQL